MVAVALLALLYAALPAAAEDSAVILSYHRFAEDPGRLTTTLAELDAHIEHMQAGGYRVLPLGQVVAAIAGGLPLPQGTVAISVEGGHESVHRLAWPRFKAAGFPFTIMVTTDAVDRSANAATWDNLREMASGGVEIGTHGAFYRSQVGRGAARVAADLTRARRRIKEELGAPPSLFSYPYGQYDEQVRD
ncbi:MAG: polysaccharide deacetylase family protein, partial [Alphaproteobacteria bacterium]|nr:polysaccharide deacetylase family protein [Alphaproteobacteria bacterium]